MDDNKWIDEGDDKLWISRKERRISSPTSLELGMIVRISPRLEEFMEELVYDPEDNVTLKIQKFLERWHKEMDLWIDSDMKEYSGKLGVVLWKNVNNNRVYLSTDNRKTSWDYRLLERITDEEWNELEGTGYEGKAQALIKQHIPPKFKELTDHVVVKPTRLNTYTILYNCTKYVFKYGGDYYYDLLSDKPGEGVVEGVKECDLELYQPHCIPEFYVGDIVIHANDHKIGKGGPGIVKKVTHMLIDNKEEIEYSVKWLLTGNISVNSRANQLIPDPDQDIFEEFCNHRCKMCCPGDTRCPMFIYKRKDHEEK